MKTITILFKTHLDIGFTGLAEDVAKAYPGYIRNAIATADYFRRKDPSPEGFRYRWTVGSWLIDSFFEQADAADRALLEKAIRAGDIVWHAMPFTTESETVGLSAFRAGLGRALDLNRRFGLHVHSAKLTDVPGHTRGIIGPFAEAGVTLLHIGTNPGCGVCNLPEAFRWRDAEGRELYVVYQTEYGKLLELPDGNAYLMSVANDNLGAHSPESVEAILADLRRKHPEAVIRSGTLDDLSDGLDRVRDSLPVVTSEIGSTWVHSAGTDPLKIARYRECLRFAETLAPAVRNAFLRELEIVTEHTGGLDTKTFLHDRRHWSGAAIRKLGAYHPKTAAAAHRADKTDHGFALSVRSWDEQREYIDATVRTLPQAEQVALKHRLAALSPKPAATVRSMMLSGDELRVRAAHFSFDIDAERGCLSNLHRADGTPLFDSALLFGGEQFSPEDYDTYHRNYLRLQLWWTHADFGKPGMPKRPYRLYEGFPVAVRELPERDGRRLLLRARRANVFTKSWEMELHLPESAPELRATLRVFGKDPSRSAHALWCSFAPAKNQGPLSFTKLGERIDPYDVVEGGGRSLHAIDGSVSLEGGASVETLDAPLLAPGVRELLWTHKNPLPQTGEPFHINLYNNIWGCNFPMWFGDDMSYRFVIR